MSEGDRQDGIAVTKIDEQAGMITFDNHGVIQTLALTSASDASSSTTGGPSGSTPDQQVHRFRGGRFGRAPDLSGGGANPNTTTAPDNSGSPTTPSYGSPPANVNNNSDRITPEAQ